VCPSRVLLVFYWFVPADSVDVLVVIYVRVCLFSFVDIHEVNKTFYLSLCFFVVTEETRNEATQKQGKQLFYKTNLVIEPVFTGQNKSSGAHVNRSSEAHVNTGLQGLMLTGLQGLMLTGLQRLMLTQVFRGSC
jgi:hypothetical protein